MKNAVINVRCTPEEKKKMEELAVAKHDTVSNYLVKLAFGFYIEERAPIQLEAVPSAKAKAA